MSKPQLCTARDILLRQEYDAAKLSGDPDIEKFPTTAGCDVLFPKRFGRDRFWSKEAQA
jgi:hypothetical protein